MRVAISCPQTNGLLISTDDEVRNLLNTDKVYTTRRGRALFITRSSIDAGSSIGSLTAKKRGRTEFPWNTSKGCSKLGISVPYMFHLTEVPVAMTLEGGGGVQINLPSNIDVPDAGVNTKPWHAGLDTAGAMAIIRARMDEVLVAGLASGFELEDGKLYGLTTSRA